MITDISWIQISSIIQINISEKKQTFTMYWVEFIHWKCKRHVRIITKGEHISCLLQHVQPHFFRKLTILIWVMVPKCDDTIWFVTSNIEFWNHFITLITTQQLNYLYLFSRASGSTDRTLLQTRSSDSVGTTGKIRICTKTMMW